MSDQKLKADGSGVFDVSKPGKSAPSSSSKPIIITNRPVLKDPMMVDESDTTNSAPGEEPLSATLPSGELTIEPLQHEKTETPEVLEPPNATKAENKGEPEPEKPKADGPEAPKIETSEDETIDGDGPKKVAKQSDEAILKKEAEREAELQKLVDSRKYYLPINQVGKRRNRRMALLGVFLIIVLGLAWADVALDAGIITIPGVKAPTHLFK